MKTKKIILPESQMPTQWYNIVSDMKNRPLPPLNPATKEPVTLEQMSALFAEELMKQEMSTERYIDIPEEVQDLYKIYRSTPLVRAYGLEKALDTPAKIYFKNESVSPVGSAQDQHRDSAGLLQLQAGNPPSDHRNRSRTVGSRDVNGYAALRHRPESLHGQGELQPETLPQADDEHLGRRRVCLAERITAAGRAALAKNPNDSGSLGMAISEAVEMALQNPQDTRYCLGSVLNLRTVAPDDHRRGGRETDGGCSGRYPDVGDRLPSEEAATSPASASRSCAIT